MSALTDAIARARRQMARDEAPVRQRMLRAYRDAIDALQSDLEAVTRMIAEARAAGIDVTPDWLRRQGRYRQLLAQAEVEFARFSDAGIRILRDGQYAAVSGGAHSALELMEAAGVDLAFAASINTPAVERLVSALQPGSPVRDVLEAYGTQAARVIEDELVAGLIEGTGPREVVRTIRRGIGSGTNRARLESLVTNEMMRSFRGSLADQMGGYKRPGDKWRRVAAKDIRTCLACLALDGELSDTIPSRFHIRCRCIFHIVLKESKMKYETGPEWFARQPETVQRAMMPSGDAFDAFQRGEVTLMDFTGVKRSPVWGTSIVQRSGVETLTKARR